MPNKNVLSPTLILVMLTLGVVPAAFCQLNSNTANVALYATLGESLTVTATSSTVGTSLNRYVPGTHHHHLDSGSQSHHS
jgi:hypothetical protein